MFKSGYVAIIGKPNAGKSTLINKLVGYKVAITTPKPQTTRFDIKGIVTSKTSQIVFIDTPGVHLPKYKLGEYMQKGITNAINSVDVIVYMVDATKYRIDTANEKIINDVAKINKKVILCINKIDKVKKENLLEIIDTYDKYIKSIGSEFCEVIPICAYKNEGLDTLINSLEKYLPEGEIIYPEDEFTDITQRQIVEETIREKLLNNLDEEIPHGINVIVSSFKEKEPKNDEDKGNYDIDVDIICQKDSHKAIIIGKGGMMLKNISKQARKELEEMFDKKINLKLWVKVRKDWQKNESFLQNIKNEYNQK